MLLRRASCCSLLISSTFCSKASSLTLHEEITAFEKNTNVNNNNISKSNHDTDNTRLQHIPNYLSKCLTFFRVYNLSIEAAMSSMLSCVACRTRYQAGCSGRGTFSNRAANQMQAHAMVSGQYRTKTSVRNASFM